MNAARAEIAAAVRELLDARIVVARDDGSARDFEELPRFAGVVAGDGDTRVVYRLGANRLETDLLRDGKTGGFLDQADNHAAVAALAPARRRARWTPSRTTAASRWRWRAAAVEVLAIDENAATPPSARPPTPRRNGLANMRVERANAFDLLRALRGARRTLRRRRARSAGARQARRPAGAWRPPRAPTRSWCCAARG